ncbi:MAG: pyruvate kinase [Sediminicola sp.]
MNIDQPKIKELLAQVEEIIHLIRIAEKKESKTIAKVCDIYTNSAKNLLHYKALRTLDLRKLQRKLEDLGMSTLSSSSGHVLGSLAHTRRILEMSLERSEPTNIKPGLSIKKGKRLLADHTAVLLGHGPKGRRVRIMVTQPTESAHDYDLVENMVKNGMDCARINCAHDGPEIWAGIINNIKRAAKANNREVKITMDLAGPKIRTGAITEGSKVRKFAPKRNESGEIIKPAIIKLVAKMSGNPKFDELPVGAEWLSLLKVGDQVHLRDGRNKSRTLEIAHISPDAVFAHAEKTTYIGTGSVLRILTDMRSETIVGDMQPLERSILLRVDDELIIHREDRPGEAAKFDEKGNLLSKAHISCQLPEVFDRVAVGESILFDDGKIEGKIVAVFTGSFEVHITKAKSTGSRLRAEKGVNFPTTDLGISGLTEKDKLDLEFVVRHADTINFSFVNSKEDVEDLLRELKRLEALNKVGIVLKIETQRGFNNINEILLSAMQVHYIGVMIARGDLAVETGWDNIGWVQNELLGICNAAHIPVIWATQVLENMVKSGLPSRSEITDVTNSLRAECVMLNKGPYINEAISLLDVILSKMESYQEKEKAMFPKMQRFMAK